MPTQLITVPVMFQSLSVLMSDGDRQDGEIDLGVQETVSKAEQYCQQLADTNRVVIVDGSIKLYCGEKHGWAALNSRVAMIVINDENGFNSTVTQDVVGCTIK